MSWSEQKNMKCRWILLFALMLPNISLADYFADKYIYGTSIIQQHAKIKPSNGVDNSETGVGVRLYADRYYQQTLRFNSAISYIRYDTFDFSELSLSADYMIPITREISFFSGATLGGALQKYNSEGVSESAASLLYGVQAGAIKYLNDHFLLELGVRLKTTDLVVITNENANEKMTLSQLNEVYFSVLFMF